ncbi:unnamed protein product [Phyllotreta striolata]|uniref:NADP-dependent oxidoreductase domain-containing protein n=1 Tax=Phyllotreta striolata TaxID=444603 RepID=A0A9N9XM50_PHYSR|nr:unnamed protein product [Phyllotreta striolata]
MLYQNNGAYKIPVLGLGTFLSTDEQVLKNVLNAALEQGYRHIDTAAVYKNEHIIGSVLKEWISSGKVKREDLFITTKLQPSFLFEDKVEEAMKSSLDNLQLDYVDLWLIHLPIAMKYEEGGKLEPQPTNLEAVWKKMEEQVDAGKTRTIGVSNFNISQIQRIKNIARIQPANLQVEINLFFQNKELVQFALKNNMSVVAYGPLGNPGLPAARREGLPSVLEDETVKKIATKHNKTAAQVAFRYLVQKGLVTIPKCSSAARVKENIDIFDFELDANDMKVLEGLDRGEAARVFSMKLTPGIEDHPEFPFKN